MLLSTLFLSLLGCTPELNDDTQTEWHTEVKDTNDHVTQVDWVEESCIVSVNDSYCNFSFMDQHGNHRSLSEFDGSYVLLDFSAMWCAPCRSAAAGVDSFQSKYSQYNFHYITVLIEDNTGATLEQDDLVSWATDYNITQLILAGNRSLLQSSGGPYYLQSWPTFYYINKNGIVEHYQGGYSDASLTQNVEYLLRDEL